MDEPLDELYLTWLYSQTGSTRTKAPSRTYWNLMRELFTTEFEWFIARDDARADDGIELRIEFLNDAEIPEVDPVWMDQGCSFLEMLVALSRRLSFQTDIRPADCFWQLIANLGLSECNDLYNHDLTHLVKEVTDQVIYRTYEDNGLGGLFPLRRPKADQTKVEIWAQMCAYVIELDGR